MQRIVIIGGGITGCASAAELAAEGHHVTLLEARGIAAMASGWTLGGVRQSGRDPAELPLARAAVDIWATLGDALHADVEYRRGGNLRLARTPAEVDVIGTMVDTQRARGLDLRFLPDNDAVRAVAPAISRDVLAASLCPTDGHANPVKATLAFAARARALGAEVIEGVAARSLRIRNGRVSGVVTVGDVIDADCVVVAAGINTPSLLAPLALALPLSIKVVHVVQTEPLPPTLAQVFGVANADCAGRQEADGRLRFTGGAEDWHGYPDDWSERSLAPTEGDIRRLVTRVADFLPIAEATRIHRTWAGLLDLTPDALPVIDSPLPGLVVAAGFSGHGFCLGPVSGRLCADLALGRAPRHDVSSFRIDRFARLPSGEAQLTLHG